jgi:hypothetical protein
MSKRNYITEEHYGSVTKNKKYNKNQSDMYADDFKSNARVVKAEKMYSRKGKNKFKGDIYDDENIY